MKFRTKIILASFACVEISAIAAVGALVALDPRQVDPRTVKLLLGVATVSGALLAWAVSIPLARRITAVEERVRRYAAAEGALDGTLDPATLRLGNRGRVACAVNIVRWLSKRSVQGVATAH